MALERKAIQFANAGIDLFPPLGEQAEVDASKLSRIQRDAVNGILQCQDFACLLRGYAGSGKTTVELSTAYVS